MGGVPAHFICKTEQFAERCLNNTPQYDIENYKVNFREEILNMLHDS